MAIVFAPVAVPPIIAKAFVALAETVDPEPIPTPLLALTAAPIIAITLDSVLTLHVAPPKVLLLPMDTTPPYRYVFALLPVSSVGSPITVVTSPIKFLADVHAGLTYALKRL
jgi:hypothetical protein